MFKVAIGPLLLQKMKASALIVVMSMAIALACAVPLGVWSAVHRNRWQDSTASGAALLGISLPDFFWGILLILLFARTLGWLPSSGFADPGVDPVLGAAARVLTLARAGAWPDGASDPDHALDHDRHPQSGIHPRGAGQGP